MLPPAPLKTASSLNHFRKVYGVISIRTASLDQRLPAYYLQNILPHVLRSIVKILHRVFFPSLEPIDYQLFVLIPTS